MVLEVLEVQGFQRFKKFTPLQCVIEYMSTLMPTAYPSGEN
jgi:hypothetical protein